jgi:hypothetical protein
VLPSQDTSQSPDDEKILKYAVELFQQLGITKPEPDSVVWVDRTAPDIVNVRFGEVRLPRSMMGRLTGEDWRPLLAPAIIYGYVLSRDKNRGSLIRLVFPASLGEIPLVYAFLQIFRLANQVLARELLLAAVTLWAVYTLSLLALYTKWLWRSLSYIADQRAANTIGKEVLLAALGKYGETISATGYLRKRLHLWPTVSQRIGLLQRTSGTTSLK